MHSRLRRLRSFTLIELLVVMGIIAILAAITLGSAGYVNRKAAASRAAAEIAAMEAGLERYKVDNGIYPITTNGGTSYYSPTVQPLTYSNNAAVLYVALSGKTNFSQVGTGPSYMEFKPSQVNSTNAAATTYVQDPFGFPYGYTCDDPSTVTNGVGINALNNVGFFDLWSTGGQSGGTSNSTNTGQWITNWKGN